MAALWDKLPFWKKTLKSFKEGKDFNYVDLPEYGVTGVELLNGKYQGVIYNYHQARIVPQGELAKLEFGYTIINSGSNDIDELQNDTEFVNIMGELLSKILIDKENLDESFGENNPQKFDIQ